MQEMNSMFDFMTVFEYPGSLNKKVTFQKLSILEMDGVNLELLGCTGGVLTCSQNISPA